MKERHIAERAPRPRAVEDKIALSDSPHFVENFARPMAERHRVHLSAFMRSAGRALSGDHAAARDCRLAGIRAPWPSQGSIRSGRAPEKRSRAWWPRSTREPS